MFLSYDDIWCSHYNNTFKYIHLTQNDDYVNTNNANRILNGPCVEEGIYEFSLSVIIFPFLSHLFQSSKEKYRINRKPETNGKQGRETDSLPSFSCGGNEKSHCEERSVHAHASLSCMSVPIHIHKCLPVSISAHQRLSVPINAHQCLSVPISACQSPPVSISVN